MPSRLYPSLAFSQSAWYVGVPERRERARGALWAAGSSQQAPVWVSWALGHCPAQPQDHSLSQPAVSRDRCWSGGETRETSHWPLCDCNKYPQAPRFKQHLLSPILLRRDSECGSAGCPRRWVSPRPDHGVGLGCSHSQAPWVQVCSPERPPSVPSRRGRSMGQLRTRQPAPSEGTSEKSQRERTNKMGLAILHNLISEETSHHSCHVVCVRRVSRPSPLQGEGTTSHKTTRRWGPLGVILEGYLPP